MPVLISEQIGILRMTITDVLRCCAVLAMLAALQACGLAGGGVAGDVGAGGDLSAVLGRLPLPDGAKVKMEKSMVVAPGEQWIGQIHIEIQQNSTAAYAFFMKRLPQAGWLHRAGVLGERTMMHFSGLERMLSVEIHPGSWGGALVILTAIPDSTSMKR